MTIRTKVLDSIDHRSTKQELLDAALALLAHLGPAPLRADKIRALRQARAKMRPDGWAALRAFLHLEGATA